MSVYGTGIAGSIAQSAAQARQVANDRDKRAREQRPEHRRIREAFEAHLRSLEEGDQASLSPPVDAPNPDPQNTPARPESQPAQPRTEPHTHRGDEDGDAAARPQIDLEA